MKIVVDVNIILSALTRDSSTRMLILESGHDLYFPEPSLDKIMKYKDYVIEKAGLREGVFLDLVQTLFKYIRVVPTKEILKHWDEAKETMGRIDQEDVTFIATALGLDDSIIWSNDKDFEKQKKVKVFKTKDVVELFSK